MSVPAARGSDGGIDAVLGTLDGVRRVGDGWMALCPTHDDRNPSLSVKLGDGGKVLAHCHAGCDQVKLAETLGLSGAATPSDADWTPTGPATATYDYVSERGELLFQVCRTADKQFPQRRPDTTAKSGWRWNLQGVRRVPYRLPELLAAIREGRPVTITEGEKDADALAALGKAATCNPGGAGQWRAEFVEYFRDAPHVNVWRDRDGPGRKHADEVVASLRGVARKVWLIEAPEPYKDAAEMLGDGVPVSEVVHVASCKPDEPEHEAAPTSVHPTPSDARATVHPPPLLARNPNILGAFRRAVRVRGVVGEETTACILYLTVTTRLLGEVGTYSKPVSVVVKGNSASGKSFTVQTVVRFFPAGARIEMTAMSERALVYSGQDYQHRTLVIYEATALREGNDENLTAYFVRSLLSEGRIEYPVTVRDKSGGFTTKTIVKEGPTNAIITTTKALLHQENETRMLSLSTNDSREQTTAILAQIASEHVASDDDLAEWLALQEWLTTAEHRVTIPYAGRLAALVSPVAIRLRRDFGTRAGAHPRSRGTAPTVTGPGRARAHRR
ncbi:MAG: hypothetical protein ABJB98_04415 [Actinomycetota bacterium]